MRKRSGFPATDRNPVRRVDLRRRIFFRCVRACLGTAAFRRHVSRVFLWPLSLRIMASISRRADSVRYGHAVMTIRKPSPMGQLVGPLFSMDVVSSEKTGSGSIPPLPIPAVSTETNSYEDPRKTLVLCGSFALTGFPVSAISSDSRATGGSCGLGRLGCS
jgi:hypothetical protein